ncbi:hypothetical protein BV25DRAFT_1833324 [Artomyces pyxidatus]|uniref:Uncharacterized protein n=1 Tax=Artomyces pyxidatus TaxID=48021 RepID=A0ACB8SH97_9AGAM|nr:hypothetical protein BV25DRAFT_1833324 [Artomyces pyxidatus]
MLPRRHPRYTILLGLLLLGTLALLLPDSPLRSSYTPRPHISTPHVQTETGVLSASVQRAERVYQRMLRMRERLITKYGPRPENIVLFPPDKDPWPAYTVWDFFPPAFNCPHEIERVGALGDGGKWVCGLSRLRHKEDCVIYSVGSPADASFEAEVLARTEFCQLFLYDPSSSSAPRALTRQDNLDLAPEDVEDGPWDAHGRVHFKRWGVAGWEAHGPDDKVKLYTLQSLMKANGHTHIDLLKVDLEGWEFDALSTFVAAQSPNGLPPYTTAAPVPEDVPMLPVGQMLLELHLWGRPFPDLLHWWTVLERAGLRATASEPNLVYQNYNRGQSSELADYTFVNVRTPNVFTSELTPPPPPPAPARDEEEVVSKES